ncbi:MAG: XylR family transcriptional regulator, partial [Kiritimatiellia bacterium]|nr:XylR family transcriptional regulator [Kiritimatiellia bacterium]
MPRVLLIFPTSIQTCRWMLRGILRYVHQHGPWELHIIEDREGEQKLRQIQTWGVTGIIGYVHNKAHADAVLAADVPAVIVDPLKEYLVASHPISRLSRVACDSREVGRAAADYFLERRYTNFAFVGEINDIHWSRDRAAAFSARVAEHGFACQVYPTLTLRERNDFGIEQKRLCAWLKALPKPVAILAAWDVRGRQVLDACMKAGLAVPQEAALLSVDNDEILCETTNPPMSSIQMDAEEACYEGAKVLDSLMRGKGPPRKRVILYGAVRVVNRRSTEAIRIGDPLVVKALEFIWLNAGAPMTVADVARHLSVSRRLLEMHSRKTLGCTIHDEILRVRLERVQSLLRDTRMTVSEIADTCGFAGPSHLGRRFQDAFKMTPSAFRAACR